MGAVIDAALPGHDRVVVTLVIGGDERRHYTLMEIPLAIARLRALLAESRPWLPYSDRTGGKSDVLFACCRCRGTTHHPGRDQWRWRLILPELRERTPRAPRYESLCRACFEAMP